MRNRKGLGLFLRSHDAGARPADVEVPRTFASLAHHPRDGFVFRQRKWPMRPPRAGVASQCPVTLPSSRRFVDAGGSRRREIPGARGLGMGSKARVGPNARSTGARKTRPLDLASATQSRATRPAFTVQRSSTVWAQAWCVWAGCAGSDRGQNWEAAGTWPTGFGRGLVLADSNRRWQWGGNVAERRVRQSRSRIRRTARCRRCAAGDSAFDAGR